MIIFLEILGYVVVLVVGYLAYQLLKAFLPARGPLPVRILAVFLCAYLFDMIVYANDIPGVLGVFGGFLLFMIVFFKGSFLQKISIVLILYPMLISINYLSQDIGMRAYFSLPEAMQTEAAATVTHTASLGVRVALWYFCRRLSKQWPMSVSESFNTKMWLLLDCICIAIVTSVLIVLGFVPEAMQITYPVCIASIAAVIGCIYLTEYIAGSVQTTYKLKALQAEYHYYEDKLKDEERVRRVYHDMKNHLLVLQSAQTGEIAEEMVSSLRQQIEGYEDYYKTGNPFLDVMIRDKARDAKEKNIDFSAMVFFADGGFIDPLDVSTIFGNALDNAIEASEKLPEQDRLITVKANRTRDMLAISFENNIHKRAGKYGKTSKEDQYLHGFGLQNIQQAVEKYGGECVIRQTGERFLLNILIPIPS